MAVDHKLYTVEEFEQIADSPENAHRLLELIDGEIVEKMPNEEHGIVAMNIAAARHWNWNNIHKLDDAGRRHGSPPSVPITSMRSNDREYPRNAPAVPDVSLKQCAGASIVKQPGSISTGACPISPWKFSVSLTTPMDRITREAYAHDHDQAGF